MTSPTLAKPLETFKDLLQHANVLDIITIQNSAGKQFMSTTSNEYLRKLQDISDATGWNNATDVTATIDAVLQFPNKVCFADTADFVLHIKPPSLSGISE